MIHIVWEFRVKPKHRKKFEEYYAPNGVWSQLFRKSNAYHGTVLTRDTEIKDRYILFDIWNNINAFREFKKKHADEYQETDKFCEQFTEEETCLGFFEGVK